MNYDMHIFLEGGAIPPFLISDKKEICQVNLNDLKIPFYYFIDFIFGFEL